MPDRDKVQADMLAFVQSRGARHGAVSPDTDLLDGRLLDSLLLTDLILHIEDLYRIQFDGGDVSPMNFRTVSAMVDLVLSHTSAQQPT
jgi:acyl carrier protein